MLPAELKPSANLCSAKGSAGFCQGPPQAGSGSTPWCLFWHFEKPAFYGGLGLLKASWLPVLRLRCP